MRLPDLVQQQQVFSEAAVMMASANAIPHYTDAEVAPLLARAVRVQFLPQATPFFAAQRSFDLLAKAQPDYTLRQPADNPTNPSDRPTDWERTIIETFQTHPDLATLTTERTTEAGAVMSFSQPVRVTEDGCLSCHSTPQAAPASVIDAYSSANGFGWRPGSIAGAQIVLNLLHWLIIGPVRKISRTANEISFGNMTSRSSP